MRRKGPNASKCGEQIPGSTPAPVKSPSKKGKSRAMSDPGSTSSSPATIGEANPIPIKPSLLKRFYEPLALMAVLGKNRGDRVDEEAFESEDDPSNLGRDKLRRSFLRNLAYLCDYEKGGDRTTAIALEQTPQGIVYWSASNKSPNSRSCGKDRTKTFLERVLSVLQNVTPGDTTRIESELFADSLAFSSSRIAMYIELLGREIDSVLQYLLNSDTDEDMIFTAWLQELKDSMESPANICRMCFETRHSKQHSILQLKAKSGNTRTVQFEGIHHLIGRLNHTMKAVKVIVAAGLRLPHLFDTSTVIRIPSSHSLRSPLQDRNPSLQEIMGRMVNDPSAISSYREALQDLDQRLSLSSQLHTQCTSSTWKPRVHAELLALNHFWTEKLGFLDGDPYIGCSKPACYCCYHYIRAHPGRFVVPACHMNNYLNWRAPDIMDANDFGGIKVRENILNEMAKKIRLEVLAQVLERRGPARGHPDSLTEISTFRAESLRIPLNDVEDEEERVVISEAGPRGSSEHTSAGGGSFEYEEETGEHLETDDDDNDDSDGGAPLTESSIF